MDEKLVQLVADLQARAAWAAGVDDAAQFLSLARQWLGPQIVRSVFERAGPEDAVSRRSASLSALLALAELEWHLAELASAIAGRETAIGQVSASADTVPEAVLHAAPPKCEIESFVKLMLRDGAPLVVAPSRAD